MQGKYGYCTNNDGIFEGEFDTREEAIEDARYCGVVKGDQLETGRYNRIMFTIDVNDVIESLNEHACAEAGEVAEDFLQYVPKSQRDELEDTLNSCLNVWLMKHEHDQVIFSAIDIQSHKDES